MTKDDKRKLFAELKHIGVQASVPTIFGVDAVAGLTGLSKPLLHRWARDSFYVPERGLQVGEPLFSFRDVVSLRVLAILRQEHGISRQELHRVGEHLRDEHDHPWAALRLGVSGKEVVFMEPATGRMVSTKAHGNYVFDEILEIKAVEANMRSQASRLMQRQRDQLGKTEKKRAILGGRTVFAGTRIAVAPIADALRRGAPQKWVLENFPTLRRADVELAATIARNGKQKRSA
jgi:uncharacterized protein (DUF433 family)